MASMLEKRWNPIRCDCECWRQWRMLNDMQQFWYRLCIMLSTSYAGTGAITWFVSSAIPRLHTVSHLVVSIYSVINNLFHVSLTYKCRNQVSLSAEHCYLTSYKASQSNIYNNIIITSVTLLTRSAVVNATCVQQLNGNVKLVRSNYPRNIYHSNKCPLRLFIVE